MIQTAAKKRKRRLNPKRVQLGWRALAAAAGLWFIAVATSRVGRASAPMLTKVSSGIDARLGAALAILGIIAVIAAWGLLLPLRRMKAMRDWAIALLLLVFLATDLYLLSWSGLF